MNREREIQHKARMMRSLKNIEKEMASLDTLKTHQLLRVFVALCMMKEEDPRRLNYVEEKVNSLILNEDQKRYLEFLVNIIYSSSGGISTIDSFK